MKPGEKNVQIYQVFKETLGNKPKFIPYGSKLPIVDKTKDYYVSIFQYNEEQKKQAESKGTLSGIRNTTTDFLCFDFDKKDNLEAARKDALTLVNRLVEKGINQDSIEVCFTGSKGFSVEVFLNKRISNEEFKNAVFNLAEDLETFDTVVNDPNRIIRVKNTKHPKTANFKVPLELYELDELNSDQIVALAKTPRQTSVNPVKTDIPKELLVSSKPEKKTSKVKLDDLEEALESIPRGWKNYKWALAQGFFESGERHNALMIIAATSRGLGYDKQTAYYICKSALKKQSERSGEPEFDKVELYENIIENSVYSDNWEGGQYSPKTNKWLESYCKKMNFDTTDRKGDDVSRIQDIQDGFEDYVNNIDKNTILTGIKRLDKAMPITIGMNLGIVGAASSGKCLGKDTPVLMFDGTIKMVQDVKVGDKLMGDDSEPRNVLSTCSGREKLYKIEQENGNDYIVNESHILSLRSNHSVKKKTRIKKGHIVDINIKDYLNESNDYKRYYKGFKIGVEYPEQKIDIDPYFLGLWLGDGDKNNQTVITSDEPIVNYLETYSKQFKGHSLTIYQDKRSKAKEVSIVNKKNEPNLLLNLLRKEDLIKNKHIPYKYLVNNRKNRLKLFAGLIDSDGHWSASHHYEISLKDKALADQVVTLSRSLGFKTTIQESIKGCMYKGEYKEGLYHRIYINGKNLKEVPVLLERKKADIDIVREILNTRINVVPLEEGNYYGFEIDGNHRFLLGDFTVTHNTALALEILRNTSKAGVISVFASLDMHRNRLYEKLLYKTTGLSREEIYQKFKDGKKAEITQKIEEDYKNVWFYDRSSPTVDDIRKYVEEVEASTGQKVKLVMLDYFERVGAEKSEDTAASKEVAGKLQDLINDLNLCVITLVQPNKFSLSAGPDCPITSYTAIKGSSFLYQSFRSIISIWRPFFTPEYKDQDKYLQMAILKNDLGELDLFNFAWNGKKGDISEMTMEQEEYLDQLLKEKNAKKDAKSVDAWE